MAIRTVLQALDSSRYKKDRPLDRSIDIAHARSEMLLAFLFGYEIVVPANDVADSPAFQALISEIHRMAKAPLESHKKTNGVPLQLFKIGLEDRYRRIGNYRGYSAFVHTYRRDVLREKEEGLSARDLVQLSETAAAEQSSTDMIRGMAAVYLNEDEPYAKLLEATHPDVFQFTRMMRSYFEPSVNTAVEFAYLDANPLSRDHSPLFQSYIGMALNRAARRGANDERVRRIRLSVADFMASDLPKSRRSHWRKRDDIFGDDSDIIRDWLDFALYGELFSAFGVNISSYFTQECTFDRDENDIRMGALSDRAFAAYGQSTQGTLLPQADRVDWAEVIALVTSKPMVEAIKRFHTWLSEASRLSGERREIALEDAKLRHIDFLRHNPKGIYVEKYLDASDKERLEIRANIPTSEKWAEMLKSGMKVATNFFSLSLKPFIGSGADAATPIIKEIGEKTIGPIGRTVDFLLRPSQVAIEDGKALVSNEMGRLNFWIR